MICKCWYCRYQQARTGSIKRLLVEASFSSLWVCELTKQWLFSICSLHYLPSPVAHVRPVSFQSLVAERNCTELFRISTNSCAFRHHGNCTAVEDKQNHIERDNFPCQNYKSLMDLQFLCVSWKPKITEEQCRFLAAGAQLQWNLPSLQVWFADRLQLGDPVRIIACSWPRWETHKWGNKGGWRCLVSLGRSFFV